MKINFNYPQLAAEFLIVFVGVAVALAADSWREDLQHRRTEQIYLGRLVEDLALGQRQLEAVSRDFSTAANGALALISILEDESKTWDDESIAEEFVNSAQLARISVEAVTDHDTTYSELTATGRLNLITDIEIRTALLDYYEFIQLLDGQRSRIPLDIMIRFREITGLHPDRVGVLSDDQIRRLATEAVEDPRVLRELRFLHSILIFTEPRHTQGITQNQELLSRIE